MLSPVVTGRTFTVTNGCSYPVWPAIYTDMNVGTAVPSAATGWQADPGSSITFSVPNTWTSGRIWARTNCDFTTNPGPTSCVTGGCNGGLFCDATTGTGVPPASLAEFTLGASDGNDWYDVSLVDGFNVPVTITNDQGCPVANCPVDLNPNCPQALKGPVNASTGVPFGCKSDCLVDPNPTNSPACCSGAHGSPQTCPPTGVPNYQYFKSSCPNSYVYAYDESSGTALFTCPSSKNANYNITFCPAP